MIDGIKINNFPVSASEILQNNHLTFPLSNIASTGEMLNRAQVAHYGSTDIVVKGGNVKMKGSAHKHFEGGTNYKDFSIPEIQKVITDLANTFQFDPKDALINFIEIGVNIEVMSDPSSLIKNFLIYRHKEFETLPVTGKGYGRKCETQRFMIKIYNKSMQYGLPFHLLRFEVKVSRMEFLKQYGIDNLTMDDLRHPYVYPKLQKMLLNVFNRILIFNSDINIDSIQNQKDRELVLQGRYPEYWRELPRQRKSEQIKRFIELTGKNNLKSELAELIENKWNKLLNPDKLTTFNVELDRTDSDKLTTLQTSNRKSIPDKLTTFNKVPKVKISSNNGQINTTINCYSRICPITKVDISMQKDDSRFLSTTGLRWLKDNELKKYDDLRKRYLSRSGVAGVHTKYEEDEIYHLAKQIRNTYNNPRRGRDRISENQLSLL